VQQTGSTHLGETFSISVESGAMQPAFFAAGPGEVNWAGFPLPLAIPGTSMPGTPGCVISIEADVPLGLVPYGGAISTFIPNDPSLVGVWFYWQAVMFDPALTTPTTLASSDHLKTTLGS
jgi:hypothetical protein